MSFGQWVLGYLEKLERSNLWLSNRIELSDSAVGRWINDGVIPRLDSAQEVVKTLSEALKEPGETLWLELYALSLESPKEVGRRYRLKDDEVVAFLWNGENLSDLIGFLDGIFIQQLPEGRLIVELDGEKKTIALNTYFVRYEDGHIDIWLQEFFESWSELL